MIAKLYDKYILPKIVDNVCSHGMATSQRALIVPKAYGLVVEIGIGSGLNIPFYNKEKVSKVIGVDPSKEMWELRSFKGIDQGFEIEYLAESAENISLPDNFCDSIVITFALCTIPDPHQAIEECKRILKPNGKIFFAEHGISPDKGIARAQNFINPAWSCFGGGCNLNRNPVELFKAANLEAKEVVTGYETSSFKFASYVYSGAVHYNE